MKYNIVILGAGNVGYHLTRIFSGSGNNVMIWSRNRKHSEEAAKVSQAHVLDHPADIPPETDFCIAALNEDALSEVCSKLPEFRGILLHTAGSVPIDILKQYTSRCGVLYPLQTFTKKRNPDYFSIPVFIEALNEIDFEHIYNFCKNNFQNVIQLDSEKRKFVHLAAVFACNFVNASLMAAEEISSKYQLDFHLFQPLIKETIAKTETNPSSNNQTGPAMRNNIRILEDHIGMLDEHRQDLKNIYVAMTNYIKHNFQHE